MVADVAGRGTSRRPCPESNAKHLVAAFTLEVARGDPGAAHQQVALNALPSRGNSVAGIVDDLHARRRRADAPCFIFGHRSSSFGESLSACLLLGHAGDRAERTHLGHAPGMHAPRRRTPCRSVSIMARGAAEPPITAVLHGRELEVVGLHVIASSAEPHGRARPAVKVTRSFSNNSCRLAPSRATPGKHQLGADQGGRVGAGPRH
jgi:hypothetical protein